MNVFLESIQSGKVSDERQLKRLYRMLAKKLHPDISAERNDKDAFIRLKNDYELAIDFLAANQTIVKTAARKKKQEHRKPDFSRCAELFSELMAQNFPIDERARGGLYLARITELNTEIGLFGAEYENLFLAAESELYKLKGKSVVLNHEFNVVILYLYNLSDCFRNKTIFAKIYVKNSYANVIGVLHGRNADNTVKFIDLFAKNILAIPAR
jgi:hypothetical protein